ncbi:NatB N-acetyltransferase complex non catalytic subunit Arm1 [Schizosaccharomyces cryophilus OY26]|uniref:NatB N-acetyltransferase complex non catalytic subunit Arm1 n=1 Tax=Schizosaccharomyces cryophilus (strain OY26 / ATCC MYA-4695 / CBS 11777 / NBRC 106824 / NRRL Y48691) TaxID=653667 RepID=S9WWT9_SCHCR|nr:NatB N-acetyltransferase complex non catalytic subunit Arm1 [Schizosaccharomyces cryophilus OY26]EPY49207.1 NatB N-acetyltransferase complex non catalytic subunit Arm1 [Schizosaccharomyces cryophilus OY26]
MRRSGNKESTVVYSALSLAQSGRGSEAIALLEPLKTTVISSLNLIDIIQAVYEDQKRGEESFQFWEKFLQAHGKNEKHLSAYFKAAVRTKSLIHQRKAAVELQKLFPSRKHTLWVLSSLYLLCKRSENEMEQRLLKALAEKTASITFSAPSGHIDSCEECHLYLDILSLVGKKSDAVELLLNEETQKFVEADADLLLRKLQLLADCESWDTLFSVASTYFQNGNIDWKICKALLECSLHDSQKLKPVQELSHNALSTFHSQRNLHLLWIHFTSQFLKNEHENAILNYVLKMCGKPIVFEDIVPFLQKLSNESKAQLLENFTIESCPETNKSQKIDKLVAKVLRLKIQFFCFESFTQENITDFLQNCFSVYQEGLSLSDNILPTDFTHGYEALLLAVHALMYFKEYTSLSSEVSQGLIFDAICLLEKGLTSNLHNFNLKLPLIRLYLLLDGGFPAACKIYDTMSIKQVQNDTMDHYLLTRATTHFPSTLAAQYLNASVRIYASNEYETPEMICNAYEEEAYSQIENMREFRSRLDHSMWKSVVLIERARCHYLNNYKAPAQYLPKCSNPKDNRDLDVFVNYASPKFPTAEHILRNAPHPSTAWVHLFVLGHMLVQEDIVNGRWEVARSHVQEMESICDRNNLQEQLTLEEVKHVNILILLGNLGLTITSDNYDKLKLEEISALVQSLEYENSTSLSVITKQTEILNDLIICLNSFVYHVSSSKKKEFLREYQALKNLITSKLGSISVVSKYKKKNARKIVSELFSHSWLNKSSLQQVPFDQKFAKQVMESMIDSFTQTGDAVGKLSRFVKF